MPCVQRSWTTLAGVSPVTVIASEVNHVSLKDNIAGVRNFTPEDNKDPNVVIHLKTI